MTGSPKTTAPAAQGTASTSQQPPHRGGNRMTLAQALADSFNAEQLDELREDLIAHWCIARDTGSELDPDAPSAADAILFALHDAYTIAKRREENMADSPPPAAEPGCLCRTGDEPPTRHGVTTHGHRCCHEAPHGLPRTVARCGGPPLCAACAAETAAMHVPDASATEPAEPAAVDTQDTDDLLDAFGAFEPDFYEWCIRRTGRIFEDGSAGTEQVGCRDETEARMRLEWWQRNRPDVASTVLRRPVLLGAWDHVDLGDTQDTAAPEATADAPWSGDRYWHMGRFWFHTKIEDACPCPKEPCGLVSMARAVDACTEHPIRRGRTMRQGHHPALCPGADRGPIPDGSQPTAEPELDADGAWKQICELVATIADPHARDTAGDAIADAFALGISRGHARATRVGLDSVEQLRDVHVKLEDDCERLRGECDAWRKTYEKIRLERVEAVDDAAELKAELKKLRAAVDVIATDVESAASDIDARPSMYVTQEIRRFRYAYRTVAADLRAALAKATP